MATFPRLIRFVILLAGLAGLAAPHLAALESALEDEIADLESTSSGPSLQPTGSIRPISTATIGTNCNAGGSGPGWSDAAFQTVFQDLEPGNVRYPGGTVANYWDWRTGNFIPGSGTEPIAGMSHTIPVFLAGLPPDTVVTYVVNLARPTPATGIPVDASDEVLASQETLDAKQADILAAIAELDARYDGPLLIELGNEFYSGAVGGVDGQGAIYSGDVELYLDHAEQVADSIAANFPEARIAIIAAANSETATWNQAIIDRRAAGGLAAVDALTFHWYTGPGVSELTGPDDVMTALQRAYARSVTAGEQLAGIPTEFAAWVTEYNHWSPIGESTNPNNPGNGGPLIRTWTSGLFGAAMTIGYANLGERVSMLHLHNLQGHPQWAQISTPGHDGSGGNVLQCLGAAQRPLYASTRRATQSRPVAVTGFAPPNWHGERSPVMGAWFGDGSGGEEVILINASDTALVDLDCSAVFTRSGPIAVTTITTPEPWVAMDAAQLTVSESTVSGPLVTLPAFSLTTLRLTVDERRRIEMENPTGWVWELDGAPGTVDQSRTVFESVDAKHNHVLRSVPGGGG